MTKVAAYHDDCGVREAVNVQGGTNQSTLPHLARAYYDAVTYAKQIAQSEGEILQILCVY